MVHGRHCSNLRSFAATPTVFAAASTIPTARTASAARDEMRMFTSRESREHPPSHRVVGRVKQMSQRANPEVQDEPDRPSIGVVGRARGNSLAEDPSSYTVWRCALPQRLVPPRRMAHRKAG